MEERKLSKALEGKFEMKGYLPGEFKFRDKKSKLLRSIDTRTATVAQAREAIENGFGYLKEINKKETSASTGSGADSKKK